MAALLIVGGLQVSFTPHVVLAGGGGGGGGASGGDNSCGNDAAASAADADCGCGDSGSSGGAAGGAGGGADGGGAGGGDGGVSCVMTSCSATNICGVTSVGTQGCGTSCSAVAPANPSGSCSVAVPACGADVYATGFNGCNGGCNITSYPFCGTVDGTSASSTSSGAAASGIVWLTLDSSFFGGATGGSATDVALTIVAHPPLVRSGMRTMVRWLSTEMSSCTVHGDNGDEWSGVYGEHRTSELTQATTYTLTCEAYDGSTHTDSVTVRILPNWQEI